MRHLAERSTNRTSWPVLVLRLVRPSAGSPSVGGACTARYSPPGRSVTLDLSPSRIAVPGAYPLAPRGSLAKGAVAVRRCPFLASD